jgi:hypothetical protein
MWVVDCAALEINLSVAISMMQSDTQVDQFLVHVEISLLLQPSALGSRRKHRRKTWFCDSHQTFQCSSGDQKHPPGKAPNERVLGHETFGPLIQLTEGLLPPSFSWLLFPFQPWHRALQEKFQQNQPILGQLECVQYASQAHCASPGDSAGPVGRSKNTITVIMPQSVHILKPCGSCKAEAVQELLQVWCETDLDI